MQTMDNSYMDNLEMEGGEGIHPEHLPELQSRYEAAKNGTMKLTPARDVLVHQARNILPHTLVLFHLHFVEEPFPDDECRDINALRFGQNQEPSPHSDKK